MDDEFAVLEGNCQHLERAAGLVVSEIQGAVVGVTVRRAVRCEPSSPSPSGSSCVTRAAPGSTGTLNAARNLAALAAQASEPSCGRTKNQPAGNPHKTATRGNGYRHGKTPPRSQGRHREVAVP